MASWGRFPLRQVLGKVRLLGRRATAPFRQRGIAAGLMRYPRFFRERATYISRGGDAPLAHLFPQVYERGSDHAVDTRYFFQAAWAARRISSSKPALHVDVGSDNRFVAVVSAFADTVWVDLRRTSVELPDLLQVCGNILGLPFPDDSVSSLSCLSVLEHIGLGRYGDDIDPAGMQKGARELTRILAPGGHLYLSLPVGRDERVEFNAHRVMRPEGVAELFERLSLQSFSVVIGDELTQRPLSGDLPTDLGNGLFHFVSGS